VCTVKCRFSDCDFFIVLFSLPGTSAPDRFNEADFRGSYDGRRWGRSKAPPDVEWDSRVTHYNVEFSPDGRLWIVIKDENGLPRVRDISSLLLMVSLHTACLLPSILPVLNSGFCSIKRLRLLLVPSGWDASPTNGYLSILRSITSAPIGRGPLLKRLGGERGSVRVKCFAQQHSTMISKYMALKLPFYSAC